MDANLLLRRSSLLGLFIVFFNAIFLHVLYKNEVDDLLALVLALVEWGSIHVAHVRSQYFLVISVL